jgi:hypothetical protein
MKLRQSLRLIDADDDGRAGYYFRRGLSPPSTAGIAAQNLTKSRRLIAR